jgi:hypothetical protein
MLLKHLVMVFSYGDFVMRGTYWCLPNHAKFTSCFAALLQQYQQRMTQYFPLTAFQHEAKF